MRKDIYERMKIMQKDGIKPNYAKIARQMDCDYRTVKKYFEGKEQKLEKAHRPSKLDGYRQIIENKVDLGCTGYAIYRFIQTKGYSGKYSILRDFIASTKKEKEKKATIRFETNPGLQAQVDWKEEKKMISKYGEIYKINIFLILLGFSRLKFFDLTLDRNEDTLQKSMIKSFKYFGGIPREILFDNMKTVVDHSKSDYSQAIINQDFYHFSKDMGFEIITCKPYRPQTKGKVEALAKLTSRLDPYNYEFETFEELEKIVKQVCEEVNSEISQATKEIPKIKFQKEKEYLLPLPHQDLLDNYFQKPITRIVTKESMVTFMNKKYSLNTKYIGKTVTLKVLNDTLDILYNDKIITSHKISNKKFNYHEDHYISILKSDAFKDKKDSEIEKFAKKQLSIYDKL